MNVTSLFSRLAAVCAMSFGVALVSETSLTARGQPILTKKLQEAGHCVVWGSAVDGPGVSSSRGVALLAGRGVQLLAVDLPEALHDHWGDGRIVAGQVRLQSGTLTCLSCYAHVQDADAREDLLTRVVNWTLSLCGHVVLGGDFNTALHDSPALMHLVDHGFHSVNTSNAATCCTANSSTGTVIDHVFVSPSLCPALLSSEVLSEAPFPTHKPVAADLAIDALRDIWQVLRLPRPFPVGSLVAVDGEPLQMHSRLSVVQAMLAAGDPERAYEIWTALAEDELARLCRRGVLAFHLSRVSVFVVISISKDWKKHVPGWLNCVPNGRQASGLALNRKLGSTLVVGLLWWMMFARVFLRKSPPCVRSKICWVLCGHTSILETRGFDIMICKLGDIACWHLKRIASVGPRPSMSLGSLLMTPLLVLTRLNLCGVPSCVSTTFPLLQVVQLLPVPSLLLLWCLDSLK